MKGIVGRRSELSSSFVRVSQSFRHHFLLVLCLYQNFVQVRSKKFVAGEGVGCHNLFGFGVCLPGTEPESSSRVYTSCHQSRGKH